MIYVDNNATTAVAPEVRDVMLPFFNELYYNPSSMYPPAQNVAHEVKKARQTIAQCLDIEDPSEILFTSCASESNNAAIFGSAAANSSRKHIITTSVEHPAVLEVCKEMERRGYRVTYLKVNKLGELDMREYVRALDEDTLIVSIMHANNETGVVFPVEDLARIAKETDPKIIFHTDATQTMTKLPLNYQSGLFDLVSFSGHKFHAPKGVGGLYIRKGTRIRPFLIGGHQENGRRAGTENVAYIVGMAEAMKLAAKTHAADSERIRRWSRNIRAIRFAKTCSTLKCRVSSATGSRWHGQPEQDTAGWRWNVPWEASCLERHLVLSLSPGLLNRPR